MAQHDYVIDNSTGANVRADINNVLAAIVSNNSGSSEPATKYAYQWWADTNTGTLKIRNSANNAWVELLQLDGTLTLEDGSASTPALAFRDDLNTGIFSSAADTFNVATGGVERMELGAATVFNEDGANVDFRIEGDNNANLFYLDAGNDRIGVGISSPEANLHVHTDSNGEGVLIKSTGNTSNALTFDANRGAEGVIAAMYGRWNGTTVAQINFVSGADGTNKDDGAITFGTESAASSGNVNATERMRIDSSGRVLIGHSSARTGVAGMGDPLIQHEGLSSDDSAVSLIRNTNSAFGGSLILGKTRGTSVGANTLVQNGDDIFTIRFAAGDGTDINSECATIKAEIDGVASANDVPGRLAFATTADGASSPTERMRIDSSGRVLIGTTSAVGGISAHLQVVESDGGKIALARNDTTVSAGAELGRIQVLGNDNDGSFQECGKIIFEADKNHGTNDKPTRITFYTTNDGAASATEKMRLSDSSVGQLFIGCTAEPTSGASGIMLQGNGFQAIGYAGTGSGNFIEFNNSNGNIGRINGNASTTSYITSSDYRLKENETAISDGITRLKTLKPYRFNFKTEPSVTLDGFFAHEVSSAVPIAVLGDKDATKEDGSIEPQGIDHSKLVPLLVAAVQELITKVETLEAA